MQQCDPTCTCPDDRNCAHSVTPSVNGKTVLTMGTFDMMHPGHLHLFTTAWSLAEGPGGRVVVGVNPDEFVEQYKGKRPVQPYDERVAMVTACRYVDEVYATPGADASPLILQVKPDIILIGDDWKDRDYLGQLGIDEDFVVTNHITIIYLDRVGNLSTTELKARVKDHA